MSGRIDLPGADELFRPTTPENDPAEARPDPSDQSPQRAEPSRTRAPSGRTRHDEKITIYVTADELMDLEATRLALRRQSGLGVDRGRIVRAAIHLALEQFDADGDDSALVRRLREQ